MNRSELIMILSLGFGVSAQEAFETFDRAMLYIKDAQNSAAFNPCAKNNGYIRERRNKSDRKRNRNSRWG